MVWSVSLILVLISFVYSVFINIAFRVKKHVASDEVFIYKSLMTANLIGLIIEFLCLYTISFLGVKNMANKKSTAKDSRSIIIRIVAGICAFLIFGSIFLAAFAM